MARASWQGYITLGGLGIPVRLYPATQSLQPRFTLLHADDGSPVERSWRCQQEQREISHQETIRAIEDTPGHYITITDRELERASSAPLRTVTIKQFCDDGSVAPLYYARSFYAVAGKGGERAYALIREVFARTQSMAIAEFTLRLQDHIAALAVHGDVLMLHQLHFAAEILPRSSLKTPALPKPSPTEIARLMTVVERFRGPFYIEDYHDEHSEQIRELIERKRQGLPAPRHERPAAHATPEADIVATLEQALRTPHAMNA